MFSNIFKHAVTFLILMGFVVIPVSITVSDISNAVKHPGKECDTLDENIDGSCSAVADDDMHDCSKITITITITDGNCDTSNEDYDCYLYDKSMYYGSTKCYKDSDGNCIYSETNMEQDDFDECYHSAK